MPQTEAAACPKHIDLYAVAPHHHALTRAMLGHGGSWGRSGHGSCWGMQRAHVWRMLGHEPRGMGYGCWGMDDVGAGQRMAQVGAWGCMCWRPSCPKLTFHASLNPPPPTTCRSSRGANGKACTTTSPSTHRSSSALISGTVGRLFMHDCAVSWT